jgi:type IV secretion system protein VirB4
VPPVLIYLFHRLEDRFDGRPTLLILDEAWTFLDDPLFSTKIRAWLKTLRKKNVAVVFATQSLADIERSAIAPAIIESCPTRIFLPNSQALEPQARAIYERFGLNARQIEILAVAAPKRDYYAQTARGNRLFELGLGPIALALCAASTPHDQRLIDRCLAEAGAIPFVAKFLSAKNLGWAAELIASFARTWPTSVVPAVSTAAIQPMPKQDLAPAPAPARKPSRPPVKPAEAGSALPGLPGGPPLPERFSPYRAPKQNRSKR